MSLIRSTLIGLLLPMILMQQARASGPLVAVASNFAKPMRSIAQAFETQTGVAPVLSFGSSGKFYAQIRQGAPFELFLSADQAKPVALEQANLIVPGSRFTYAEGSLVLWSAKRKVTDASSLDNVNFKRLAMANPRLAPYGAASIEVLEHLGVSEKTRPRWIIGENIAQAFLFTDSGNADLGFVAASQVTHEGKLIKGHGWLVPTNLHTPIRQDAVLLPRGANNPHAVELFEFLKRDAATAIMRRYGYHSSQPNLTP